MSDLVFSLSPVLPASTRILLLCVACYLHHAVAFMYPVPTSVRRTARQQLRMQQNKDDAWQDVAENLADPFVSPFDKPGLLLKLAQRAPDVTQVSERYQSGN